MKLIGVKITIAGFCEHGNKKCSVDKIQDIS